MLENNSTTEEIKKPNKKSTIICISILSLMLIMIIVGIKANKVLLKKGKASERINSEYTSTARDTSFSFDSSGNMEIKRNRVEDKTENMEDSWTVLIYMTATNLESMGGFATTELERIKKGLNVSEEKIKNMNLIIETGACKKWRNNYVSSDKLCRIKLNAQGSYEVVDRQELSSMGDPDTLADFIDWGITNYPSKHTMLIFWDHGGPEMNVCYDELYNKDALMISEIEYAFAKIKNSLIAPLDIVMFSTCNTGTIETANSIAPYANYMIANPGHEACLSYDFQGMIDTILNKPESSAENVCDALMDGTNEKYFKTRKKMIVQDYRYVVYNLKELDNFLVEFNKVFKQVYEIAIQGKKQLKKLNKIDRKTFNYAKGDNIDIGDYLTRISKEENIDVSKCKETMEKVVYKSIGGEKTAGPSNSGLALYHFFGDIGVNRLNNYRNRAVSPYYYKYLERTYHSIGKNDFENFKDYAWENSPFFYENNFNFLNFVRQRLTTNDESFEILRDNSEYVSAGFVQNWYDNLHNVALTDREEFTDIEIDTTNDTYNAKITSDAEYVNTVYNSVFAKFEDSLVCLGENGKATYDDKTGEIKSNFNGEWLMLKDGQLLTTYVEYIDEDCVQYSIPVMIDGEEASIYILENGEGITTQGFSRTTRNTEFCSPIEELESGIRITPIYDIWDDDSDTYNSEFGEEYTYNGQDDFLYTTLKDSDYYYSFIVEEGSGYKSYSKQQPFTVKDDKIVTDKK